MKFDIQHEEILNRMGIKHPNSIQTKVIPEVLKGHNLVVTAQTGSGKTLAFLLPILTKLTQSSESRALILAPTREVVAQIHKTCQLFFIDHPKTVCLIVAGQANKEQVSHLKKNPRIIIATPGRLNDHLRINQLLLKNVDCLVIDEADRMMDPDFVLQLKNIRKTMRGHWQTLMFSASFNDKIKSIANQFMSSEPVYIEDEKVGLPVQSLKQKIYFLMPGQRNDQLAKDLKNINGQTLVFVNLQPICEEIGAHLKANGFSSDFIHGGLALGHRNRVMKDFQSGKIKTLITTDLLARGLDIEGLQCVVNFELPVHQEDFIHRIGRTARAGQKGIAITYVIPSEKKDFDKLKDKVVGAEIKDLLKK